MDITTIIQHLRAALLGEGLLGRLDQRHDRGQRRRLAQEGVLQELGCARAAVDVHLQALVQEILEDVGKILRVLQLGRAVGGNQIQRAEGILVEVRRLALDHLDRHDAQRPDVDLRAVLLPRDDLGGHPVRRAHHGGPLRRLRRQLRAEPEVGELDIARHAKKDVITLDIAVDDRVRMQELEGLQALAADGGDLALVQDGLGDDIRQRSTRKELHDNPELVLANEEAIQVVDDVLLAQLPHDEDLVDDQLLLGLLRKVHLLDRNNVARAVLCRRVHCSRRTLANLLVVGETVLGIRGVNNLAQARHDLLGRHGLLGVLGPLGHAGRRRGLGLGRAELVLAVLALGRLRDGLGLLRHRERWALDHGGRRGQAGLRSGLEVCARSLFVVESHELVGHGILASALGVVLEHIEHALWILGDLLLRDARDLQKGAPLLGQAGKFAGFGVKTDVDLMDEVQRGGDVCLLDDRALILLPTEQAELLLLLVGHFHKSVTAERRRC
eukprot:m.221524 g.221524  ORF g.221524 m.221524 type:complete len:498 (+) comp10604_c0_seq1:1523-3016(+)